MRKHPWYEDLDGVCYCPACEKQIDDLWKGDADEADPLEPEYCPYCGQHLDWLQTVPYGLEEEHV